MKLFLRLIPAAAARPKPTISTDHSENRSTPPTRRARIGCAGTQVSPRDTSESICSGRTAVCWSAAPAAMQDLTAHGSAACDATEIVARIVGRAPI